MGVLACDRHGCGNIMCDRLSDQFGYLCDECFKELVNAGSGIDIAIFMDTPPSRDYREALEAYYNEIFKMRT